MLPIDSINHQKVKLIGKKEINTEKISVKQIYNLGEIIYFLIFQTNYLMDTSEFEVWKEYSRKKIIYKGDYTELYIVENIKTKIEAIIKIYDKSEYNKFHSYEFNETNIKNPVINSLLIKTFDTNNFFYIVMENTDLNLIDFLK